MKKIPEIDFNTQTLAKNVTSLYELIKNGSWFYFYDDDLDQLYITPKKGIDRKFNLIAVNSEMSVYLDKKSQLGGVMISYFKSNLTNHDDLFKKYKRIFTKQIDGGKTIPKKNKDEIKDLTLSIIFELEKSVLNHRFQ